MDPLSLGIGGAAVAALAAIGLALVKALGSKDSGVIVNQTQDASENTGRFLALGFDEKPWPSRGVCNEKHKGLDERQSETIRRIDNVDSRLTSVETRLVGLETKVVGVDSSVIALDKSVIRAIQRMDDVTDELESRIRGRGSKTR